MPVHEKEVPPSFAASSTLPTRFLSEQRPSSPALHAVKDHATQSLAPLHIASHCDGERQRLGGPSENPRRRPHCTLLEHRPASSSTAGMCLVPPHDAIASDLFVSRVAQGADAFHRAMLVTAALQLQGYRAEEVPEGALLRAVGA